MFHLFEISLLGKPETPFDLHAARFRTLTGREDLLRCSLDAAPGRGLHANRLGRKIAHAEICGHSHRLEEPIRRHDLRARIGVNRP
jgi:hypothetical protein